MVWPAVIAGVASLAGSAIQGISANKAAGTAAAGAQMSREETRRTAAEAKKMILDQMGTGMVEYANGISDAQQQIAMGNIGAMQILQDSTGQAQQMLAQVGADAQKLIMGDAAVTGGIPFSTFSAQYDQIQQLPPSARTAAMGQLTQDVGQSVAQTTGADPAATTQQIATDTVVAQPQPVGRAPTGQQIVEQAAAAQAAGPQTGFTGAKSQIELGRLAAGQQLQQGAETARGDIAQGAQTALGQIAAGTEAAMGRYQPYSTAGQAAIQQEAALSGAMGPEAQQAAIDAYIESPGQKYLREQQEKALLRSSAAIGGLGGGAVRTALQEQAMGIASTQQQQYLENLRSIAGRGQQVAGAEAGLLQQQGLSGAGITTGASQQLAGIAQQLGMSQADLMSMSATQLANLAQSTGLNLANLQQTIGLAQTEAQQTLGTNLAGLQSTWGTQAANLAQQEATNLLNYRQNIGQSLAGISQGQGAQISNTYGAQAQAQAAGQIMQGQAIAQGLSGLGQIAGYYGQQQQPQTTTTQQTPNRYVI